MTATAPVAQAPSRLQGQLDKILKQMDLLLLIAEKYPESLTVHVPEVSQWSIGQHLDHMATTDQFLVMAIEMALVSPPKAEVAKLKMLGRVVLLTGYIPRGKGKAPDMTVPKATVHDVIVDKLQKSRGHIVNLGKKLAQIESCTNLTPHPVFGGLTPSQWLRFIDIHNYHHIKIIRDIERRLK